MKKVFLPLFALVSVGAFAQIEIGQINLTVGQEEGQVGVDKNAAAAWKADQEICKSASVKMMTGAADSYITQGGNVGSIKYVVFENATKTAADSVLITGGKEAGDETHGMQGQTNGTQVADATTEGGYITPTIDGCVYKFTPTEDGYLYAVGKYSSHKNLYAFEEPTNTPGTYYPLAYRIAWSFATTVKSDVFMGYLNADSVLDLDLAKHIAEYTNEDGYYTGSVALPWPEKFAAGVNKIGETDLYTITKRTLEDGTEVKDTTWSRGNGWIGANDVPQYGYNATGVIAFPVYANCNYYVFARGSKLTLNGFAFSKEKLSVKVNNGGHEAYLINEDGNTTPENPTPVKVINANVELDANAPIYNLLGQKVENVNNAGVYIQNGKKFIVK